MKDFGVAGLENRYFPPAVFLLILFLNSFLANGQAIYNPSYTPLFTVSNKPYAMAGPGPDGGRTYKADSIHFLWRPFNGVAEVLTYFPVSIPQYRTGQFPIEVNIGGTLQSNGTFLGGAIYEYWWRNGQADSQLVLKAPIASSCVGCLLAANNLSDLINATTARSNLGLGTMATQNVAAAGDLTGNWNNITVAKFNGQLPSFYLAYANLTGKPPPISLVVSGTSGPSSYNSGTGVLTIPNYSGGGGSCLGCNADSLNNIPANLFTLRNHYQVVLDTVANQLVLVPYDTIYRKPGVDSIYFVGQGRTYAILDSIGAGAAGITALSGDGTATGPGAVVFTLANVNSSIGNFNNVTVNAKGLVTSASNVAYLTANQTINFTPSGDVTGSASGATTLAPVLTLATLGSSGSCLNCNISVDAKGRVTSYASGSSGTGGTNSNVGSGYRWAIPLTNNVKTVFGTNGILIDSATNANALTFQVDSSKYIPFSDSSKPGGVATQTYVNSQGFIKANQVITLSNDVTGSGSTAITSTVVGIRGVSVPTLSAGLLRFNGSAFTWDNTSYLTNITGLITNGTNISITGSGTSGSPYVINASSTGGTPITNLGALYRLVNFNSQGVKTIGSNYGILFDSTTTNQINLRADTATLFPQVRASIPGATPDTILVAYLGATGDTLIKASGTHTLSSPRIRDTANSITKYVVNADGSWTFYGNLTLTTTGTSGAATFTPSTSTLNIPQYSGGGGGGTPIVNLGTGGYRLVNYNLQGVKGLTATDGNSVWDSTGTNLINLSIVHPNTRPTSTVSSATTFSLVAGDYIEAIWVDPTSATTGFQVGTTPTGSDVVPNVNLLASSKNNFFVGYRATGSTTLYFQGISSSTVLTLIKQQ